MGKAFYKKGEPICIMDSSGFDICCQDTIVDKKGRTFTINSKGQAVSEGGQLYDVRNLEEPMVLNPVPGVQPRQIDVPAPAKAAAPKPAVKGVKLTAASKSNELVLSNVARAEGISSPRLAKIARDAGIKVSVNKHNKRVIDNADREKLSQAIASYRGSVKEPVSVAPPKPARATDLRSEVLATMTDKDLADELRSRGYTVTAVKHVEL